jgi:hypothetical protein
MKKKDIVQLVKKLVKEDAYGSATLTTQGPPRTGAIAPTDEYPFSRRPKRTATGMMEFDQPKSFDPDTLALVRDMLYDADIHHNELVGGYDEPSSYLDKRTGGTIIKIPHFNGPGPGALFGKETVDKIDRSKAAAKTVAAKLYYKFKQYIEDYEISDHSQSGVYGNINLWMMFNDLAKDYSAPKGGTQSSQFENKDNEKVEKEIEVLDDVEGIENLTINISEEDEMAPKEMAQRIKDIFNKVNGVKNPVQTPEFWKNRFRQMYGIDFPESLKNVTKDQALAMNRFGNDLKPYLREAAPAIGAIVSRLGPMVARMAGTAGRGASTATRGARTTTKAAGAGSGGTSGASTIDKINKYIDYADTVSSLIPDDEDEINEIKNKIMKLKKEVTYIGAKGDVPQNLKPEDKVVIMDPSKSIEEGEGECSTCGEINCNNHDDEGRMAKSQMYKMKTYVDKLSSILDDGTQLPAWVQAKVTKASSMMSAVFHYLDYEKARDQEDLMEHVDKHKKRAVLMEGAMKRLFSMFDREMTDEEIVQDHATKGVEVPEAFISKVRKQWETLKKAELELELGEKEFKNSARDIVNNPVGSETGMEPSEPIEDKQLASSIFNEELDPVGQEDDDVNNDGKVNKTDKYLKNKRKKTSKAIAKNKNKK